MPATPSKKSSKKKGGKKGWPGVLSIITGVLAVTEIASESAVIASSASTFYVVDSATLHDLRDPRHPFALESNG